MSKSNSSSKSSSPRAMPVETIVTRFKSAQQKRLREMERPMHKFEPKGQKTKPKRLKPDRKRKENKREKKEMEEAAVEEFHPSKLKRQVVAKKVELKPKHELKLLGQANKRKRRVPRKELPDTNSWLARTLPPSRDASPKPKRNRRKSPKLDPRREEMLRLIEDSGSLDDEDLLEILTCPSPVWWEDPPDGYIEEALFCRPRSTAEVYPSIRSQLLQETVNKKRSCTPNVLLRKRKAPTHCDKGTHNKDEDEDENASAVNVELSLDNCDEKFIKKRSKLESLLGNLKNKTLNVPKDDKVSEIGKGHSVIAQNDVSGSCKSDSKKTNVNDASVSINDSQKSDLVEVVKIVSKDESQSDKSVRSVSDVSRSDSQSVGDVSPNRSHSKVSDVIDDVEFKDDEKVPDVIDGDDISDKKVGVITDVGRRAKTNSESTDDDHLSDLGLQDEDILSHLENMDIPVESKEDKITVCNPECNQSNLVRDCKTEFCTGPPKKLTKFRNVNLVAEVKATSSFSIEPLEKVSNLSSVNNEGKTRAKFSIEPSKSFATVRSSPVKTYSETVIYIPKETAVVYDPKQSGMMSSPIEDYLQMELVEGDTAVPKNTVRSNHTNRKPNVNSLLKPIEIEPKDLEMKQMIPDRTDFASPSNKTVTSDTAETISNASNLDNLDSISDTNICFLNDDDGESVEKKSDATNSSDICNSDENLLSTFHVTQSDQVELNITQSDKDDLNIQKNDQIDLNISNNNNVETSILDTGPKQIQNRTESVLKQPSENKINCIKIKDRFKYRFLLSTLDADKTKGDNQSYTENEAVNTKSNFENCAQHPESESSIDEISNNVSPPKIKPIIIDTVNNVIKQAPIADNTSNGTDKSENNGQMNYYFKKCKNVYRRATKPNQATSLPTNPIEASNQPNLPTNPGSDVLDVRKDLTIATRESVINPPNKIVDTNENVTEGVIKGKCCDDSSKKSIVVSDSKQIKYCLKCSSIFDTDECIYCYRKSNESEDRKHRNIYQYYKCDKCSFKSVRKSRFLRHLSDCGKC